MKKKFISATSLKLLLVMLLLTITVLSLGGFYYLQDMYRNRAAELNLNSGAQTVDTPASKIDRLTMDANGYEKSITNDLDTYIANINPDMLQSYYTSGQSYIETVFAQNKVKTQPVTVVLKNPVKYTDLVKFIKAVETNIPKISIKNLNIKDDLTSDEYVEVEPITLEVYIK